MMSDNNNLNEQQETAKLKISPKTDLESRKVIEETYNLYSTQKVEIQDEEYKKPIRKGTGPLVTKKATSELVEPKPVYKDIESVNSFNPEIQKYIKQNMNSETKAKVDKLVQEMTKQEEDFFTRDEGMLGNLKKSDKEVVAKKMEEMKVAREITEVNVSAIMSCIDNILPRKSK